MLLSSLVLVLYFLTFFVNIGSLTTSLGVSDWGAGLAGLTFVYCLTTYLWTPIKDLGLLALASYLLLLVTAGVVISSSGGVYSPFIALWLCMAAFAAVFGLRGLAPAFLLPFFYGIFIFITTPTTSFTTFFLLAIAIVVPLVASYIIFSTKSKKDGGIDTYNQLANELSEATNKAEVVINAIDEGVIALSSGGVIELMNPAAQRIVGWGRSDALGLDYRSVLKLGNAKGEPVSEALDPISNVLATNTTIETRELAITTGSGKRIALSIVVSPIGQPGQGALVVFRNITREQAEEREQAEFISTASHEMRTPVASIEGYLGLALNPNTAQVDEKARDYISKAQEAAQHLGRLFQDLLDVSKAEDGRLSNHPNVVDVTSFIEDVVEGLRPKAEEKGLRLFFRPAADEKDRGERTLVPVFYANVDNDHLREIVANLVENAIKYTPQGDVVVDIKGDDEYVSVSIKDSGIGIPREDIPHLFQKFYRVDNSQTREIGGTGLGLYLCRRLAEVMGGRIRVESDFGKGSTFFLDVPRTDRQEAMRLIEAAENNIASEQIQAESRVPIDTNPEEAYPDILTAPESAHLQENADLDLGAPQPQPQVVPPQPAPMQQPVAPQDQSQPTLSTIEANPQAFMPSARAKSLQIPIRGPGDTNQP